MLTYLDTHSCSDMRTIYFVYHLASFLLSSQTLLTMVFLPLLLCPFL